MYQTLYIVGIICAVFALGFLIATVAMFFGFNIRTLRKDLSGSLEQNQLEEIRKNSNAATNQRNRVNVFEELEKKAKVKKANTHSLNVGPTTHSHLSSDTGTSVLRKNTKQVNSGFIIEKNIMFVSTNEVM